MGFLRTNGYTQMGSPSKSTKCTIIASNTLAFLLGFVLIACGTWVFTFMKPYHDLNINTNILVIAFWVIGVVIVLTAFLGCYVAVSGQYRKIHFVYGSLLGVLILGELSFIGATYYYKTPIHSYIYLGLKDTLDQYGNNTRIDYMWNEIQSKFECCGIGSIENGDDVGRFKDGYLDWKFAKNWQSILKDSNNATVPESCCKIIENGCGKYRPANKRYTKEINKIGCLAIFYNIVVLMNNVAAVGSAMLLLQLIWITIKLFV